MFFLGGGLNQQVLVVYSDYFTSYLRSLIVWCFISDALGYVVSSDIHARENFPPFPASIKDGYAVITEDCAGPRHVISSTVAGDEVRLFTLSYS